MGQATEAGEQELGKKQKGSLSLPSSRPTQLLKLLKQTSPWKAGVSSSPPCFPMGISWGSRRMLVEVAIPPHYCKLP